MNRTGDVLSFLRGGEEYVSGDYISSRLRLTRTAVWKHIRQLRQMGYSVYTRKGVGYRLSGAPDRLYPWEVQRHLRTACLGREMHYEESTESTNMVAFRLALAGAKEGTCIVADAQSAGKGRLQRAWFSPACKNLYLSVILRPPLHPAFVYPVSFLSSLAVRETLLQLGLKPSLKWPNDVLVDGRKICGTLLELSTEADLIRFVVVGIGLNINMEQTELPPDIATKATSLLIASRIPYERALVCGMLLNNLEAYYESLQRSGPVQLVRTWEEKAEIKGKYLEVNQQGEIFRGTAEGVADDGALLLSSNGTVQKIIAGDVAP